MQKSQIDALLIQLKGATFVGLDTVTDVKLTGGKANPMQGRVQKHTTGARVQVFSKGGEEGGYARMVRRRLDAQPGTNGEAFDLSPRAWGTRIDGTCYVEHKGAYYMEVIFINAGTTHYTLDGNVIAKADIVGLPAEREVDEDAQGGLAEENRVIIRTYKMDSIVGMRAFGQEALAA